MDTEWNGLRPLQPETQTLSHARTSAVERPPTPPNPTNRPPQWNSWSPPCAILWARARAGGSAENLLSKCPPIPLLSVARSAELQTAPSSRGAAASSKACKAPSGPFRQKGPFLGLSPFSPVWLRYCKLAMQSYCVSAIEFSKQTASLGLSAILAPCLVRSSRVLWRYGAVLAC